MNGLFPERREVRCILSDPPWPERGAGKSKRGADRHYPVADVRDIPDIMRSGMADLGVRPAEHAHHWMWVTDNYLADALWCLDVLGFRYIRCAVWVKARPPIADVIRGAINERPLPAYLGERIADVLKLQVGLGQYLRGSHELLLLGVRGKGLDPSVRTDDRGVPSVIYGRRTEHSRKPESSYDLIERVSRGPRVELFARRPRAGWGSWGNEFGVPVPVPASDAAPGAAPAAGPAHRPLRAEDQPTRRDDAARDSSRRCEIPRAEGL